MRLLNRFNCGWIPNAPDGRDWTIDRLPMPRSAGSSLVTLWGKVSEVLDQRNTSSCVAHAVIAAAAIDDRSQGRKYIPLSVLFAYYNSRRLYSPKISDTGTQIRLCLKGVQKFGCPDSKYWPFSTNPLKVNRRPGWEPYAMGLPRRDVEYYAIANDRVNNIKKALANGFPVVFGTALTNSFGQNPYKIERPGSNEKIRGYHAMTIIGYRNAASDGILFEVLNSWGSGWGVDGRCWMTAKYIEWSKSSDFTVVTKWNKNV